MNKEDILVIDDEADIRSLICGILSDEGYKTRTAAASSEAYEQMAKKLPSLVILDIWLQNSADDGLQILKKIKASSPHLPVIMISGHGTIETAVAAIKDGAYDFIEKPFKADRLLLMIRRALENALLKRENESLRKNLDKPIDLIGHSDSLKSLKEQIGKAGQSNSRVLIAGEQGTGKEVAARAIHYGSPRSQEEFYTVNCASLRDDNFNALFLGSLDNSGLLSRAAKGTIFFDEICDLTLSAQSSILRLLQEQKNTTDPGPRIIAATSQNIENMTKAGKFREDLYYRLNVISLKMPSLRERIEDIPLFCAFFLENHFLGKENALPVFSNEAMNILQAYKWPGNIRQLKNAIEWTAIMLGHAPGSTILPENLPPEIRGLSAITANGTETQSPAALLSGVESLHHLPLREAREVFEREYLLSQVNRFEGNISKTALFVGMERSALHRKLKSLQDQSGPGENETAADSLTASRERA